MNIKNTKHIKGIRKTGNTNHLSLWHPKPFVSTPKTPSKAKKIPLAAIIKMAQVKPSEYNLPHFKCTEDGKYYKVKYYAEWKPSFWEPEREVCKFCLKTLEGPNRQNAKFNRAHNKSQLANRMRRKRRKPSNKK